jgi:hypothetical protein
MSFFRHSGPDPESRKSLKPLDPPVNPSTSLRAVSASNGPGDDDITTFVTFCKGLNLYRSYPKLTILMSQILSYFSGDNWRDRTIKRIGYGAQHLRLLNSDK